jgi:hypothetical protein
MPLDAHDIQRAEVIEAMFAEAGLGVEGRAFVRAVMGTLRADSHWRAHLWEALDKVATLAAFAAHEKDPAA